VAYIGADFFAEDRTRSMARRASARPGMLGMAACVPTLRKILSAVPLLMCRRALLAMM
jgi:hypothetical protein